MPRYQFIQTLLCKNLNVSKTAALNFIYNNQVKINDKNARVNDHVYPIDQIKLDKKVLQEGIKLKYFKLYKPRGIECTLNKQIENNLHTVTFIIVGISYIGRLDKESEGLLILTNDGSLNKLITQKNNKVEKEYLVKVDKEINSDFINNMSQGIEIMGKTTLPCRVDKISTNEFKIILTQGINRQIRRMCYKLGYDVTCLKRIRIGNVYLGELKPGEMEEIGEIELN